MVSLRFFDSSKFPYTYSYDCFDLTPLLQLDIPNNHLYKNTQYFLFPEHLSLNNLQRESLCL